MYDLQMTHMEQEFPDPVPVSRYRVRDTKTGKFVTGVPQMHEGVSAEIISVADKVDELSVSKAFGMQPLKIGGALKPTMNKLKRPKVPKPPMAPTAPKTATVPQTAKIKMPGVKTPVFKAMDDKEAHIALGTGAASGAAAGASGRLRRITNTAHRKYYDARIARAEAKPVKDIRNVLPKDSAGRTVYASPDQRRNLRAASRRANKEKYRKIHALKNKRARVPIPTDKRRVALALTAGGISVPTTWYGARKLVEKAEKPLRQRLEPRDIDAAVIGGAGAGLGYQGASYGLKVVDRRNERKIKADPVLQDKYNKYAHANKPRNVPSGDRAWVDYFRKYPKDLPGGKMKRVLSRTHAGKSGTAAMLGVSGLGAFGAARTSMKRRENLEKAWIEKRDQKKSKDHSGVAVGTGTAVGTVGLIGGGIPGARPNSGRLNQALGGTGTKTEATRHLVSAARGGVFGYREDAHARYMKNQQDRLKNWKPHSRINAFERGREAGKIGPEKTIIRTMKNARVGSNIALGGGAALVGAGLYRKHQNDKKLVSKAKQDDGSKFRSDAMISAGVTTTGGSVIGAKALDRQGNKWAARSASDVDAAQKKMPKTGGYDIVKQPKRGTARNLYRPNNRVPDVKPHKSTGTLMWEGKDTFAGRSNKYTEATGRLRGSSGQKRYFAGVYGKSAAGVRKYGIPAGVALTAAGLHHKYYKVERRDNVNKSMPDQSEMHVVGGGPARLRKVRRPNYPAANRRV